MATAVDSPTFAHTPFYQFHRDHGAKMVDFAGWEMPLHYGSIIEEHHQVRRSGGIFDVSHMGRVRFSGRDARKFLDHICTRQIIDMKPGQARYSLLCNEKGGCRDDVLIYRLDESVFLMVCNAANREKLLQHFDAVKEATGMVLKITDETTSTAMVAIQGPRVIETLSQFTSSVSDLKRYRFVEKNLLIAKVIISRTGYSGEDGVEIILPVNFANQAVKMMLSKLGDDAVVKPAGLGARDSLRLEAGMALYGHEITEEIDPISAGLIFAVKVNKGEEFPEAGRFIGQDAIEKIASEGPKRRLVGLHLEGKRSARQGMKVFNGDTEIGFVTSGCLSPTLGHPIAMAYVDADQSDLNTNLQVDLGKTRLEAKTCALPFYKAK